MVLELEVGEGSTYSPGWPIPVDSSLTSVSGCTEEMFVLLSLMETSEMSAERGLTPPALLGGVCSREAHHNASR